MWQGPVTRTVAKCATKSHTGGALAKIILGRPTEWKGGVHRGVALVRKRPGLFGSPAGLTEAPEAPLAARGYLGV
jgi:hypothetical protein